MGELKWTARDLLIGSDEKEAQGHPNKVEVDEAAEVRHVIFPQLCPIVRRDGRVIYRTVDGGVVTDEARNVRVDQLTHDATLLALSLAAERFGHRPLIVRGTNEFRLQAAMVAGREALNIAFSDQSLDHHRVASRDRLTKSLERSAERHRNEHSMTRDHEREIDTGDRGRD